MPAAERLSTLLSNLRALGAKRLLLLGGTFAGVVAALLVGTALLNAPTHEPIYANLEPRDASRVARELAAGGLPHRLSADGTAVLSPIARVDEARMFLAERGLPQSEAGGYELFDAVGSLGLTSFMQEVTRVRALEGEIARTIRGIDGVAGARVHLVLGDPGSFRRERQQPSASIVITTRSEAAREAAPAIRHLVAAAVPGLAVAAVTVLDDRGRLLASGEDMQTSGLASSLTLVRTLEVEVEDKVARALMPFLGAENFRVSAKARVDTTREEVSETVFDPDSRVERETRIERESSESDTRTADEPVTVERDLPDTGDNDPAAGDATSERDERRTETTSYEINSKTVNRVRDAFRVDRLTVAVVVNRKAIGGTSAPDDILAEIRRIATSAAGMDEGRGDALDVTAIDFTESVAIDPVQDAGLMALLHRHLGTGIAAIAFVLGLVLLALLLRPVMSRLLSTTGAAAPGMAAGSPDDWGALPDPAAIQAAEADGARAGGPPPVVYGADPVGLPPLADPAGRLARLVEIDEERAAQVLRQWINEEAA